MCLPDLSVLHLGHPLVIIADVLRDEAIVVGAPGVRVHACVRVCMCVCVCVCVRARACV